MSLTCTQESPAKIVTQIAVAREYFKDCSDSPNWPDGLVLKMHKEDLARTVARAKKVAELTKELDDMVKSNAHIRQNPYSDINVLITKAYKALDRSCVSDATNLLRQIKNWYEYALKFHVIAEKAAITRKEQEEKRKALLASGSVITSYDKAGPDNIGAEGYVLELRAPDGKNTQVSVMAHNGDPCWLTLAVVDDYGKQVSPIGCVVLGIKEETPGSSQAEDEFRARVEAEYDANTYGVPEDKYSNGNQVGWVTFITDNGNIHFVGIDTGDDETEVSIKVL